MMTFLRLGLFSIAISLCNCVVVTSAPEPSDFKLSQEELSHKFPATRKTGTVRLYAQKIDTTRDQWGRESHQATGGAVLVKESHPPVFAEAASISVTPDYSEASGNATVKKDDRLYIGQDDSASIRIDGMEIIPSGLVATRRVAAQAAASLVPAPTQESASAASLPAETPAPQAAPASPAAQPESAQPKPKTPVKRRSKPAVSAKSSAASKPAPPPAPKTPATAAKPSEPSPDKPKAPAANPNLLNLMREPTDR